MSPESPRKYLKWVEKEISLLKQIRNQDTKSSWEEVTEEFNKGVSSERERNVSALKNKWREITKVQFCAPTNVNSNTDQESYRINQSGWASLCPPAEA